MVTKNASETVEFFKPTLGLSVAPYIEAGIKQGIHHIGRYEWASIVLKEIEPRNVLDIACGAGYGSKILSDKLPRAPVTGADYDARGVDYASRTYSASNLSFVVGDVVTWRAGSEPLGRFDAVTSFDTIEHLLYREIALMRICDNLSDDGCLLLSTPCGHRETKLNPGWEHHKIEYSHSDLFHLLARFFKRVIQPQDGEFIGASYWNDVINAGAPRYLNRMNPVICMAPIRPPAYKARI